MEPLPPPPSSSSSSSKRELRPRKDKQIEEDKFIDEPILRKPKTSRYKRNAEQQASTSSSPPPQKKKRDVLDPDCKFVGDPIPDDEARRRWPHRYDEQLMKIAKIKNAEREARIEAKLRRSKKKEVDEEEDEEDEVLFAVAHYQQAQIDTDDFVNLGDDVHVEADEGRDPFIGRILEFFRTTDGRAVFTVQWFYRALDTIINKANASLVDCKRVFISDVKNDNPLDCILSRITVLKVPPNVWFCRVDLVAKKAAIPPCDFYYDMSYSLPYSAFSNIPTETIRVGSETSSITCDGGSSGETSETKFNSEKYFLGGHHEKSETTLLDLYSGCGAMSTGLCLGASFSGVNLVTRWAVDFNEYACESLRLNHPETQVRNETAENFLSLLKEWRKLCEKFNLLGCERSQRQEVLLIPNDGDDDTAPANPSKEFEVERLVQVCFGDPNNNKKAGVHFKVRWKGYGSSYDSWEPLSGLNKCKERIQDFVKRGYNSRILPLPGDVDVICGGPPCQGASGFNRFRNKARPLDDEKNRQLVVFMDIVEYLKPRCLLMENVVDIFKFSDGFLGRYAMGRIVSMDYQARMGMMAAGTYGLPQFRGRAFLWGARPSERNVVAYEENTPTDLKKALLLGDAISDLPPITNVESQDEMPYKVAAQTEYQKYIRSSRNGEYVLPFLKLLACRSHYPIFIKSCGIAVFVGLESSSSNARLYDHRPLKLNQDDYERVCLVPKSKGANFRNLAGVIVRNNKVEIDDSIPRVYLSSGKPLVPDYAITFCDGTSSKPFGRLWWDDIVPTVVTRAEPHNQVIMHPEQDRVLSIRENARIQGFPDYYKLFGSIKERYMQVGNAVAIPVSRALGFALGLALQGICDDQPLCTLPANFSSFEPISSIEVDEVDPLE
ncbi:hypothetical protein IFM89_001752 [Coptis chinensis]|uniref:DNA (cytosine-5-)-methyltransferase n=1 Tax=Coptis chinensis TaxID=261450 RepID=A0A835HHJ2_9MAGN|nr:hypothetical protein IFM89_001752 [Coptis chinensis]